MYVVSRLLPIVFFSQEYLNVSSFETRTHGGFYGGAPPVGRRRPGKGFLQLFPDLDGIKGLFTKPTTATLLYSF
jgi:hypothetical protein